MESMPLSAQKPSHVVVSPKPNEDYGTQKVKVKPSTANTEHRRDDTSADSGLIPGSAGKQVTTELGKNNNNSEADF